MKAFHLLLAILLGTSSTMAQEVVPLEEAQDVARKMTSSVTADSELPLTIEADPEKPSAVRADKVGVMIVPAKELSAEKLGGAGESPVPVGQLWSLRVTLAANGKAIDADKLRIVPIQDGDETHQVELYLLGARKNDQGKLELIVFGKGKEPVARVPLSERPSTATQQVPIELSGHKENDDSGTLTLNLFAQYQADLPLVRTGQK